MEDRIAHISDPNTIIPAEGCSDLFFRLFNSTYDGICIFEVCGAKVRALYLNDRYFQVIGYSREQYLPYYDNVTITLFEEDEKRIFEHAAECVESGGDFFCEARGYRFDGSIGWFCIRARIVDFIKSENPVFLASINDVTPQKNTENMLRINSERYRILEETSSAFLLDYDWRNDVMTFSPGKDREDIVINNYTSYLRRESPIYDEDVVYFCHTLFKDCRKKGRGYVDVRSMDRDRKNYSVCRIIFSSIEDEYGEVIRVVGRIEELYEATGLIPRFAEETNVRATEYLGEIKKNIAACNDRAFMIVCDIDDFNSFVNKYGKAAGDDVLKLSEQLMKSVFPEGTVIFHYLGDEFVVFAENITESDLHDIADKFRAAFRTAAVNVNGESVNADLTFCAGAAWTVCDEKVNLKDFFITAERALIKAKKAGRDRMHVEKIIY